VCDHNSREPRAKIPTAHHRASGPRPHTRQRAIGSRSETPFVRIRFSGAISMPATTLRPINTPIESLRIDAPTRQKQRSTWNLVRVTALSRSYPERDESGARQYVALSTRATAPHRAAPRRATPRLLSPRRHPAAFVLARARACQSIIPIGLLKFLATDGERMDIHSFGPALRN